MPSWSLPIGGGICQYLGYPPLHGQQFPHNPPVPPPCSPANIRHITIDSDMMMVSPKGKAVVINAD